MNVTTTLPPPASLLQAEAAHGDLDARILSAEQRLIGREEGLHRSFHALGLRVRQSWQPRRLLIPAVGIGVVLVGMWWLNRLRRRKSAGQGAAAAARPGPTARRAGGWIPMVGLAWPMLPASWRARVHPTVAKLVLYTGLPLLQQLLSSPELAPLATAGPLDRRRLTGVWYELGRLPASGQGAIPTRWRHVLREDGSLELLDDGRAAEGRTRGIGGLAKVIAGSGAARWHISHWPRMWRWLPMAWHQEAVLHLDDGGTELMLGSHGRDRLRLLARQPHLPQARLEALLAMARERGFAVERLHFADDAPAAVASQSATT